MNLQNTVNKIDNLLTVEGIKQNWTILAVPTVFLLALYLRFLPESGLQYLQALDPYMIYRMSKHIALGGNYPALDFTRYFPYATPTYVMNLGDIVIPAILYWAGPFLFFKNYMEWAQFYPALMGSTTTIFTYLLGKELFDRKTGILAAFFLAVIPGVLRRTSAGFFEKEPIGTMFMIASFWLFTRAWKRKDYLSGYGAGITLALFTISWGGSQMAWLLYPMVVGLTMMINQDIEQLITAYTPTVLLGGLTASILNPSKFWIIGDLFLANIGMLGFLWSRYLIEELEILEEKYLKYYVPGSSLLGLILLIISPIYSDFIADIWLSVLSKITQGSGGVIAGTVAENTAASVSQLVSQLGANSASLVFPSLGAIANVLGAWPLAFIGIALITTQLFFMLLNKYSIIDSNEIRGEVYYSGFIAVFSAWTAAFIIFFANTIIASIIISTLILSLFILLYQKIEAEMLLQIMLIGLGFMIMMQIVSILGGSVASFATAPASLLVLGSIIFLYYTENIGKKQVKMNWAIILPVLWVLTNLMASVAKSRLITLAAFPVAFMAGYGLSKSVKGVSNLDYQELFENINAYELKIFVITAIVGLTLIVNSAAGYAQAQSIRGQPSNVWENSLNYMEKETPKGSVVLSWWDYGYWFESIGRRAAVADGGNFGYYSSTNKINYPLADYLTSQNQSKWDYWLEKHSVDYIVLDQSMIGKYSAVSQIAHGSNNNFSSMTQLSTKNRITNSISRQGNESVITFTRGVLSIYLPLKVNQSKISYPSAPTFSTSGGSAKIDCILTQEGEINFNVSSRTVPYCIAPNPFYTVQTSIASLQQGNPRQARMVLVPKNIKDSTIVELYLQDGKGVQNVKKLPNASNRYVKMWKVTG